MKRRYKQRSPMIVVDTNIIINDYNLDEKLRWKINEHCNATGLL